MTINALACKATAARTPRERATLEPDYWVAAGNRYDSLDSLAEAVKEGRLQLPREGLRVWKKGWQLEEAERLKKGATWGYALTAGLAGATLAAAALFPSGPALLAPMMATLLGFGVAEGLRQAGNAFATAPQIQQQGEIHLGADQGKPALLYREFGEENPRTVALLD